MIRYIRGYITGPEPADTCGLVAKATMTIDNPIIVICHRLHLQRICPSGLQTNEYHPFARR